jgi:hypothetical protein
MKIFTNLFLLSLSINLLAQTDIKPGYIILHSGDTVFGNIFTGDEINNALRCDFQDTKTNQRVVYYPQDIEAYRFIDGQYYVAKTVTFEGEKKDLFLEFLMKGAVNIYYYGSDKKPVYFIEKEGREPFLLEKKKKIIKTEKPYRYFNKTLPGTEIEFEQDDNRYKGGLIYYLQEYPEISKLVYHRDLNQKNLLEIGKKYHDYVCTDKECIDYTKTNKRGFFLAVGPVIGVHLEDYSIYDFKNKYDWGLHVFPSFTYGLALEYSSSYFKNHFFIDGKAQFGSANYQYNFGDISLKFSQYDFRFNFCSLFGRWKPFVNFGLGYYKSNEDWKYSIEYSSYVHKQKVKYTSLYPLIGLGVKYHITNSQVIKVEGGGTLYTYSLAESNDDEGHFIRSGGRWGISLSYLYTFYFKL